MHYCNDAAKFAPNIARPRQLAEAVRSARLSAETAAAAANVDAVLENLRANTAETTDYFRVLVSVFSTELQAAGNEHMKEFWAILPALSLCYVDAMVAAKDKLGKRGKDAAGSAFTDDGFALGCAYLLRCLGQDKLYDTLHWHTSLVKHFGAERTTLQQEAQRLGMGTAAGAAGRKPSTSASLLGMARPKSASEQDSAQSLEIRQVRAIAYYEEALLLQFSMVGARTFFKDGN